MVAAPPTAPEPTSDTSLPGVGRDVTAVTGRRIVAFLIDLVVVVAVVVAIGSRLVEYNDIPDDYPGPGQLADVCDQLEVQGEEFASCAVLGERFYLLGDGDVVPLAFAIALTPILLFVIVQGMSGLTVGKLVTGIRVVAADGGIPGLGRAVKRYVALLFDGLFTFGVVGLFTAGTSDGHRRLGDRFAGTFVVGSGDTGRPIRTDGRIANDPALVGPAPLSGPPVAASAPDASLDDAWADAEDWSGADTDDWTSAGTDVAAEPTSADGSTDDEASDDWATADDEDADDWTAGDGEASEDWTGDDDEATPADGEDGDSWDADEAMWDPAPADATPVVDDADLTDDAEPQAEWTVPEGDDWAEGVPIDAPVADLGEYATDDVDDADDFPWASGDDATEPSTPEPTTGSEAADAPESIDDEEPDDTGMAADPDDADADGEDEPGSDDAEVRDEWAAGGDLDDWDRAESGTGGDDDGVVDTDAVTEEDESVVDDDTGDSVASSVPDEVDDAVTEDETTGDTNPPPQWDPARRTYIQWDARRSRWLEWDEPAQRWKPIDT